MKQRVVWFVLFLSAGGLPAHGADPLVEFASNYPFIARGTFRVTVHTQVEPPNASTSDDVSEIAMDPPRWKRYQSGKGTWMERGKLVTNTTRGERVIPAVGRMTASPDESNRSVGGISAYIKPLPPKLAKESGFGDHGYAVDGRLLGNDCEPLTTILAQSQVAVSNEVLKNVNTVVLTATGKWGKHVLWLDPARNYLPLRLVQEKAAGDTVDDGQVLRQWPKYPPEDPPVTMERWTQQFETTRIEKVGGRFVVTAFTRRSETTYTDKDKKISTDTVTLTNIKPVAAWDKDPFVLTTIVADGTPVTVHDDRPIQYEWRGGKIVKKINTAAVENLASTDFKPPSGGNSWILFALGLVAVAAVGGGIVLWRRAKAKGGNA